MFPEGSWRTDRPLIVTLSNGDRLPAYAVIGAVSNGDQFRIGEKRTEKMWLVADTMIESDLITEVGNMRIISAGAVTAWEQVATTCHAVQGEPVSFDEDAALELAKRTFYTEVDEQLAVDAIRYARRLHDQYAAILREVAED